MASGLVKRVAERYLRSHLRKKVKSPFTYERPNVPHPEQEGVPWEFQTMPWWARPKRDPPDPERTEEEYAEESTVDSPEFGPGGLGYKGQFEDFREKYDEMELPNPLPRESYFGWQPKVQVSTLIDWTDGHGSEDPTVAHHMQHVGARIVRSMFYKFRRSQTTR